MAVSIVQLSKRSYSWRSPISGDYHRQQAPVLALHVDDTLMGFRGGQSLHPTAHLGMPVLVHRHRYFLRILYLFPLTSAVKTHRRPTRAVSGLPTYESRRVRLGYVSAVCRYTAPARGLC